MQISSKAQKKLIVLFSIFIVVTILFWCIPVPSFDSPYSTVVTAKTGELLGAQIATDDQWRFKATNTFSDKYIRCVTSYEDQYFFYHTGFNPVSFFKAFRDNMEAGKVIRGGSTLSMQVVRLSRNNRKRTYWEKLIEVILALRLEAHYSKEEIFQLYAGHAPFGGNVVGIDAAAWRYFQTTPDNLSWSEAATLAVLPNSPALIHPGRNRNTLLEKRNRLLNRLANSKNRLPKRYQAHTHFTAEDCELSMMEDIPKKPYPMPQKAFHYLNFNKKNNINGENSSLNYHLQTSVNRILDRHYSENSINGIENSCAYIYDYKNDEVVAYVGNVLQSKRSSMIDMIRSPRSTGSVLKPLLYAAAMDDQILLPEMVIPDLPMNISGYTPKNYSGEYSGAVPADMALSQSLNTPFVRLLQQYGVDKFHDLLKELKMSGITFPADHYGLALILGGAEISLFDVVNAYGEMARNLKEDDKNIDTNKDDKVHKLKDDEIISSEATYLTFKAMEKLNRPSELGGWQIFSSSKNVAWKTGTSFGHKDAWSVGIVDDYVVGVWVGNADREGRPGLTGINIAAPILFDIIEVTNKQLTLSEFDCDLINVEVCTESGYPKSKYCPSTKNILFKDGEIMTGVCPYHKKIFLDSTKQFRVNSTCYDVNPQDFSIYYILPPAMEWFYKIKNINYTSLPPLLSGCSDNNADAVMSFIFPEESEQLVIPIGLHGERQAIIFEIAHRNDKKIYWNLNNKYLGHTKDIHQMFIQEPPGIYNIRCIDEDGNVISRRFKIVETRKDISFR